MSYKLYVFPEVPDSRCELTHDVDGILLIGVQATHPSGREGQVFTLPDATPHKNGAALAIKHPDYYDQNYRGIVYINEPAPGQAAIMIDDFKQVPIPIVVEPPEPPIPGGTPWDIIQQTYANGSYNLETKEGCGRFTEACCENLHNMDSKGWGHVRKEGAQNQFNGHAVDAIQLLADVDSGADAAGVYDIIFSTESPEAEPAYNFVGPPAPELWYYPAAPLPTVSTVMDSKKSSKDVKRR